MIMLRAMISSLFDTTLLNSKRSLPKMLAHPDTYTRELMLCEK